MSLCSRRQIQLGRVRRRHELGYSHGRVRATDRSTVAALPTRVKPSLSRMLLNPILPLSQQNHFSRVDRSLRPRLISHDAHKGNFVLHSACYGTTFSGGLRQDRLLCSWRIVQRWILRIILGFAVGPERTQMKGDACLLVARYSQDLWGSNIRRKVGPYRFCRQGSLGGFVGVRRDSQVSAVENHLRRDHHIRTPSGDRQIWWT